MQPEQSNTTNLFLSGGGEMGMLIRDKDWENTPLGSMEEWPQSLLTIINIVLSSKFPMFLWWGPELIQFYNDSYRPSLGKNGKHPQALGQKAIDCWPEIWHIIKPLIDQVVSGGEPVWREDQLIPIHRNGTLEDVYWSFSYSPLREESGKINGVLVVCTETTDKVLSLTKLRSSEHKFRNTIKQAPVAISILRGPRHVVDLANNKMLELCGRTIGQIENKEIFLAMPETANLGFEEILHTVFTKGERYVGNDVPVSFLHPDGIQKFFLNFIYEPLRDDNGVITAIMVIAVDVTKQVEAKEKTHEAAERLSLAIEATQLSTWDINLQTHSILYSPRLPAIFGHTPGTVLSHNSLRDQIHPGDITLVKEAFEKALKTGTYYYEARIILPTKNIRWIETQGKVIFSAEGTPLRMLGTLIDVTEQRELDQKISWLASIVESSDDAIISKGLDGIISSWNDAAQRIFGYAPGETIGQHISKIIPDERLEEESDIIARIKKGERVEHFVTKRVTKNRKLIDIALTISPIKDAKGNVVGSSKIARDISIQKKAEDLLHESREHLEIVVEASELGTWELDLQTKDFNYSKRYLRILGHPEDSIYSHEKLTSALYPDDVSVRENAFTVAFATGTLNYATRIFWPDGSIHWVEVRGKVFYDGESIPSKMVGTIRDVTEERTHRQVLEESEQKFRLLADSMPQLVWIANDLGVLYYFNKSVYQYSGLTQAEIERDGWMQIVHPDDREENIRLWKQAIDSGEPFLFEHRFRRADGEYRWQLSRAVYHKDAQGKIQMWVGTSTDIHDRKIFTDELEQQVQLRTKELEQLNIDLVKSNNELAQFAYVASHDLQEPLRKIQTFATRLLDHELQNLSERGQDYFKRMQQASKRMQQLILDLLSYSRASTTEKHFELTNLNILVQLVKEQLRELIEQKKAVIKSTTLPTVTIIPYQFEQLLTNILTNALKFSKQNETPVIKISSEIVEGSKINNPLASAAAYHCIIITDNGIGFDPQFSEQIFQVFQRLHGKDEFPGTGIGLAIVKKIAENHNGIITASGEINNGATFKFYIPA